MRLTLLAAAMTLGLATSAFAQTAAPPATAGPDGKQELPPNVIQNGDWFVACRDVTTDGQTVEVCEMQQVLEETQSGKAFIRLSVIYPRDSAKPVLRILTPLGVLLQRGMTMQIDQGQEMVLPFAICIGKPPACIVEGVMEESVVNAMKRGAGGTLRLVFGQNQTVTAPFSLSGFTKSIDAIAPK